MSLLKKASIITTPTAYAEDYLYSIKPAYALGSELVTNGNFATDSDWTKGTGWTISGGVASNSGSGSYLTSTSSFRWEIGKKYRVSFEITAYNSGQVSLPFDGTGGNLNYQNSVGVKTAIIVAQATNPIYIYSSAFNGSIDNVSVKEITDADFDFDRNSTGTRVNEDYLIEDVPYNLASYSENISVWDNFRVDVELSNVLNPFKSGYVYLVDDGTVTDNHYRKKSYIYLDSSYTYTQSFFVKKKDDGVYPVLRTSGVGGNSFVTFNWDTETLVQGSDITSSKVEKYNYGWYRISMVFSNLATTDFIIGISNDVNDDLPTYTGSNKGFYVWGCQIVKGDQPKDYLKTTDRLDIPRIDYTNGEPSILLEPQSTNLCTHSVDFATGVSSGSFTLGSSSTLTYVSNIQAPDGTMGVYRLQNPATSGTFLSFYTGNSKNVSVYVKAVDVNKDNQFTLFKSSGTPNVSSVFTASNRWERFDFEYAQSSGNTGINNEGDSYVSDVYIWGAQVEDANSYATSLIHTSGNTVTRSADVANNAGNSDLFNHSEGVLYAEIARTSNNAIYELLSINSSGTENIISLGFDANNNEIWYRAKLGNTDLILAVGAEVRPQNEFFKIAIKYKSGDTKVYLNGNLIDSSTNTATSSGSFLSLDFDFNNAYPFYGNVKSVMVFKEALTDLELEKLTGYNNHELYMNYYNRLSYLGLAEEYNVESDINNYIL